MLFLSSEHFWDFKNFPGMYLKKNAGDFHKMKIEKKNKWGWVN